MKLGGIFDNGSIFPSERFPDVVPPTYSVANFAALPADATVGQRVGVTAQSGFTSAVVINTAENAWNLESGVITTSANLPSNPAYNSGGITVSLVAGSILYGSTNTEGWRWSGSAWANLEPALSVATFSLLPASCDVGHRVAVTAESGLTDVVVVNTAANTWSLERVTCASSAVPAYGSTADTWYSSGGITVTAADGCWLYDSSLNLPFRWWPAATLGTDGVWVSPSEYAASGKELLAWHEGTEDDATLAAQGYTVLETAGGGTATISASGGSIVAAATNPGSGGVGTAALYYNDAGGTKLTSTANIVMRTFADIDTPTGNQARSSAVLIDGAQAYDFGTARFGGSTVTQGQWFDASGNYPPYSAQVAGTVTVSTEGLLEIIHRTGFSQVRFGGSAGRWSSLSSTTARASASKQAYIALAQANVNGATSAQMSVRRGYIMVHG